jgi:hypothetical protein
LPEIDKVVKLQETESKTENIDNLINKIINKYSIIIDNEGWELLIDQVSKSEVITNETEKITTIVDKWGIYKCSRSEARRERNKEISWSNSPKNAAKKLIEYAKIKNFKMISRKINSSDHCHSNRNDCTNPQYRRSYDSGTEYHTNSPYN